MKNLTALPMIKGLEAGGPGRAVGEKFLSRAGTVILNKNHEFKLALTCFLASGHVLIEDIPGVGKTTFVKTIGRLAGLHFGRIQFTNDLLPGDILGSSIYDPDKKQFRFHKGPIFAQLILIDELNRATPKTQSALLQAMEEHHVTVEGETHHLPDPFFIVATQNPRYQMGTFSLPESQLDRFMMRIELGYPGTRAETDLLRGVETADRLEGLEPIFSPNDVKSMREVVDKVHVSEAVAAYVQKILELSRSQQKDIVGLSPRAGLSLIHAAKAWAYLDGREAVLPEDVQSVAISVINHRIHTAEAPYRVSASLAEDLVKSVEVR